MKDYWYPKKRLHVFVQMKHQYAIHSLPQRVSAMNTGVFCGFVAGHRVKQAFKPTIYFPEFGESTYTGIFKTVEVKL